MKLRNIGNSLLRIAGELTETSPYSPDLSGGNFGKDLKKAQKLFGLESTYDITGDELKEKYRELMKKWHPDRARDKEKAEEMSRTIQKAYSLLKNVVL